MTACSFMPKIQHLHRETAGKFFARLLEFGLFFWPQNPPNRWQVIPIVLENNPILPRRFAGDEAAGRSD
jgi:hypothetical protein